MSGRVVGLGEALVRLSAPDHERLEHARELTLEVGGAELNALIAAAAWGAEATWLTRLGDGPLGRRVDAHARGHGVAVRTAWEPGARVGLYFVEHGVEGRPTEVHYDRAGSAMTSLREDGFDWAAEVAGAGAALCSGITCALGPAPAAAVERLLAAARDAGARTFFDVNHRNRMWSRESSVPVLTGVAEHVDVLLANGHDLVWLLGDDGDPEALARAAIDRFGHELVLLRESVLEHGRVAVRMVAISASSRRESPTHVARVVDAFGGGDAALGAVVAALLEGADPHEVVDRGAWACAFQHTLPGDAWVARPADVAQRSAQSRSILR